MIELDCCFEEKFRKEAFKIALKYKNNFEIIKILKIGGKMYKYTDYDYYQEEYHYDQDLKEEEKEFYKNIKICLKNKNDNKKIIKSFLDNICFEYIEEEEPLKLL